LLDLMLTTRFQNGLGVLHWIIELGRINIMTEVSMLSAHNAMPREGHLEGIYYIFSYLKGHKNSKIVFDPAYPEIDDRHFKDVDWKDFILRLQMSYCLGCQNPSVCPWMSVVL